MFPAATHVKRTLPTNVNQTSPTHVCTRCKCEQHVQQSLSDRYNLPTNVTHTNAGASYMKQMLSACLFYQDHAYGPRRSGCCRCPTWYASFLRPKKNCSIDPLSVVLEEDSWGKIMRLQLGTIWAGGPLNFEFGVIWFGGPFRGGQ